MSDYNFSSDDTTTTIALEPFYTFRDNCDLQLNQLQKENLVSFFLSLGAENVQDLASLTEVELMKNLPLIKCRKLLLHLKNLDVSIGRSDSEPTSSSISADSLIEKKVCSSNSLRIPWEKFSKCIKECLDNKT